MYLLTIKKLLNTFSFDFFSFDIYGFIIQNVLNVLSF